MAKTEIEIKIEAWWDNLNNKQIKYLEEKFFKEDEHGINTLEKVVHCYNSLNKDELLDFSGIQ
jgi:hypothetical protein